MKNTTRYSMATGSALVGMSVLISVTLAAPDVAARASGEPIMLAATDGMDRREDRRDDRQDDRGDNRDDRQDCRDEEGLVGKDKRDCKQRERRKDMIFD